MRHREQVAASITSHTMPWLASTCQLPPSASFPSAFDVEDTLTDGNDDLAKLHQMLDNGIFDHGTMVSASRAQGCALHTQASAPGAAAPFSTIAAGACSSILDERGPSANHASAVVGGTGSPMCQLQDPCQRSQSASGSHSQAKQSQPVSFDPRMQHTELAWQFPGPARSVSANEPSNVLTVDGHGLAMPRWRTSTAGTRRGEHEAHAAAAPLAVDARHPLKGSDMQQMASGEPHQLKPAAAPLSLLSTNNSVLDQGNTLPSPQRRHLWRKSAPVNASQALTKAAVAPAAQATVLQKLLVRQGHDDAALCGITKEASARSLPWSHGDCSEHLQAAASCGRNELQPKTATRLASTPAHCCAGKRKAPMSQRSLDRPGAYEGWHAAATRPTLGRQAHNLAAAAQEQTDVVAPRAAVDLAKLVKLRTQPEMPEQKPLAPYLRPQQPQQPQPPPPPQQQQHQSVSEAERKLAMPMPLPASGASMPPVVCIESSSTHVVDGYGSNGDIAPYNKVSAETQRNDLHSMQTWLAHEYGSMHFTRTLTDVDAQVRIDDAATQMAVMHIAVNCWWQVRAS